MEAGPGAQRCCIQRHSNSRSAQQVLELVEVGSTSTPVAYRESASTRPVLYVHVSLQSPLGLRLVIRKQFAKETCFVCVRGSDFGWAWGILRVYDDGLRYTSCTVFGQSHGLS